MCILCACTPPYTHSHTLTHTHYTLHTHTHSPPYTHREIVKRIDMWGIDIVFVVGGNGGNAGANAIQEQCAKDGILCSVVGVPKSIDNDILLV